MRTTPHAILEGIKVATECHDLRVGQLFDNLFAKIREDGKDPFYIENDELAEYLWGASLWGIS